MTVLEKQLNDTHDYKSMFLLDVSYTKQVIPELIMPKLVFNSVRVDFKNSPKK